LPIISADGLVTKNLFFDLLAVHLIRSPTTSTMITIHPQSDHWHITPAVELHRRILRAGDGIYWGNLFHKTNDPTFMLIILMWHVLYAWDEAIESLYSHICDLESQVIRFDTQDIKLTRELHVIRAKLLHYDALLTHFKKSVEFICQQKNEALNAANPEFVAKSEEILSKECNNLFAEIDRLRSAKEMHDMRLKNAMDLMFSIVSVQENETALRHSEATTQISYLTMLFLPATVVASVFGMNIYEINPGTYGSAIGYFAVTLPLTAMTVWIMLALRGKMKEPDTNFFLHLLWPLRSLELVLDKRWIDKVGKTRRNKESYQNARYP